MGLFNTILAFPSRCDLCGVVGHLQECLCQECLLDLPAQGNACMVCGKPTPVAVAQCGNCLADPGIADRTVVAYQYRYPLDALIKRFKYKHEIRLAVPLVSALALRLKRDAWPLPEVMIPVPLHNRRLYQRGYNQAILICRALAVHIEVPQDTGLVYRARDTLPMFRLDAKERESNIAGAFVLKQPCRYRSVAIVDDVITSGSTTRELARLLRQAGVSRIEFWALARTG